MFGRHISTSAWSWAHQHRPHSAFRITSTHSTRFARTPTLNLRRMTAATIDTANTAAAAAIIHTNSETITAHCHGYLIAPDAQTAYDVIQCPPTSVPKALTESCRVRNSSCAKGMYCTMHYCAGCRESSGQAKTRQEETRQEKNEREKNVQEKEVQQEKGAIRPSVKA